MQVLRDLLKYDIKFRIGFIILLLMFTFIIISFFSPYSQTERRVVRRNQLPSSEYILGTNAMGQDIFWKVSFAIRNTLFIALLASLISRVLAMANGLFSGYIGGKFDRALSSFTDSFIVLPRLPILILLSFIFRESLSMLALALLLGLMDWAFPSKRYRSLILSLRERDFTYTAVFSGMKIPKILIREHFPFLLPYMMADVISGLLWAIGMEVTLSVLGLTNLMKPSIGTMLYWANYYNSILMGRWWWLLPPIVATTAVVVSLYFISSSVSVFLDPRTRLKRIK